MVAGLVPYVAGSTASLAALHLDRLPGTPPERFDISDPKAHAFLNSVALGNRFSFTGTTDMAQGALSLPGWVLLDCYLLPSVVIGFAQRAADLAPDVYNALQPESPTALVPVTGYTAIPTATPGRWVGVSLYSLVTGQRLGLRTKALALLLYGTTVQVGITQWDNSSIRIHTQFGPLKLTQTNPPIHTLTHKTFVYELDVPEVPQLVAMATSDKPTIGKRLPGPLWVDIADQGVLSEIKSAVARRPGSLSIVFPGMQQGPKGVQVLIAGM